MKTIDSFDFAITEGVIIPVLANQIRSLFGASDRPGRQRVL
jgi:hypothetical protein